MTVKGLWHVKRGGSVKVILKDNKGKQHELKGVLVDKAKNNQLNLVVATTELTRGEVEFVNVEDLANKRDLTIQEIKPARLKAGQRDRILKVINERINKVNGVWDS